MKIWIPVFRRRLEEVASRTDIFGGRPSTFPTAQWPLCRRCGSRQSFLAQIWHHEQRLDLGRDAALHLFQCLATPDCPSWEAHGGANAVLVVDALVLEKSPPLPEPSEMVLTGYLVDHYREGEDDVESEAHAAFESESLYSALDDDTRESVFGSTKLGGLPAWLQDADQHPGPGWRLAAQVDEYLEVASAKDLPKGKLHREGDRLRIDFGANFGMGVAWVFLPIDRRPTSGLMLWQC